MALTALEKVRNAELDASNRIDNAKAESHKAIEDAKQKAQKIIADAQVDVKHDAEVNCDRAYAEADEIIVTAKNSAILKADEINKICAQKQDEINKKILSLII